MLRQRHKYRDIIKLALLYLSLAYLSSVIFQKMSSADSWFTTSSEEELIQNSSVRRSILSKNNTNAIELIKIETMSSRCLVSHRSNPPSESNRSPMLENFETEKYEETFSTARDHYNQAHNVTIGGQMTPGNRSSEDLRRAHQSLDEWQNTQDAKFPSERDPRQSGDFLNTSHLKKLSLISSKRGKHELNDSGDSNMSYEAYNKMILTLKEAQAQVLEGILAKWKPEPIQDLPQLQLHTSTETEPIEETNGYESTKRGFSDDFSGGNEVVQDSNMTKHPKTAR